MLLSDLRELKTMLDIEQDDTIEDRKLLFLLGRASSWIEEVLGRKFGVAQRTEFYSGTGTQQLCLKNRPVFRNANNVLKVWEDEGGFYGSPDGSFDDDTSLLTYGTDYCLEFDQDDPTKSRSGILIRIGDFWPRPAVRERGLLSPYTGPAFGNVKVQYVAGYTPDTMPLLIRDACNGLVARMRNLYPVGAVLSSEGYEGRSLSYHVDDAKSFLMSPVIRQLANFRTTWFASR